MAEAVKDTSGTTEARSSGEARLRAEAHFGADYYGRPRFRKLVPHLPHEGTILDYGCGEGVFLHFLRSQGRVGLGVDYDQRAVEACRGFGLEAVHADIFAFTRDPENQGRYAGVMMADFVEHFDPHPLQEILRRTVGILKPGGMMFIFTPNHRSLGMIMGGFAECTIEHHNLYSTRAIGHFVEGEGMEVVTEGPDPDSYYGPWTWHPARWLKNLAVWTIGRIICGRTASHEVNYLVARKVSDPGERFAARPSESAAAEGASP